MEITDHYKPSDSSTHTSIPGLLLFPFIKTQKQEVGDKEIRLWFQFFPARKNSSK